MIMFNLFNQPVVSITYTLWSRYLSVFLGSCFLLGTRGHRVVLLFERNTFYQALISCFYLDFLNISVWQWITGVGTQWCLGMRISRQPYPCKICKEAGWNPGPPTQVKRHYQTAPGPPSNREAIPNTKVLTLPLLCVDE